MLELARPPPGRSAYWAAEVPGLATWVVLGRRASGRCLGPRCGPASSRACLRPAGSAARGGPRSSRSTGEQGGGPGPRRGLPLRRFAREPPRPAASREPGGHGHGHRRSGGTGSGLAGLRTPSIDQAWDKAGRTRRSPQGDPPGRNSNRRPAVRVAGGVGRRHGTGHAGQTQITRRAITGSGSVARRPGRPKSSTLQGTVASVRSAGGAGVPQIAHGLGWPRWERRLSSQSSFIPRYSGLTAKVRHPCSSPGCSAWRRWWPARCAVANEAASPVTLAIRCRTVRGARAGRFRRTRVSAIGHPPAEPGRFGSGPAGTRTRRSRSATPTRPAAARCPRPGGRPICGRTARTAAAGTRPTSPPPRPSRAGTTGKQSARSGPLASCTARTARGLVRSRSCPA